MSNRYIIGVDPGLTGAISYFRLEPDEQMVMPTFIGVKDMPTMVNPAGKGNIVDVLELEKLIAPFQGQTEMVFFEKVGPMPKDSRPAAFKFGQVAMVPDVLCTVYRLPKTYYMPGVWKRKAGLIKKPKGASIAIAKTLWPDKADYFTRTTHDGRAEAALIAWFGYQMMHS